MGQTAAQRRLARRVAKANAVAAAFYWHAVFCAISGVASLVRGGPWCVPVEKREGMVKKLNLLASEAMDESDEAKKQAGIREE